MPAAVRVMLTSSVSAIGTMSSNAADESRGPAAACGHASNVAPAMNDPSRWLPLSPMKIDAGCQL
jgi:hypothetical protein